MLFIKMFTKIGLLSQMRSAPGILSVTIREKTTKGEIIKTLMREQRYLFGALVETKKEKINRLKLEEEGVILKQPVKKSRGTEHTWYLRRAGCKLKRVTLSKNTSSNKTDKTKQGDAKVEEKSNSAAIESTKEKNKDVPPSEDEIARNIRKELQLRGLEKPIEKNSSDILSFGWEVYNQYRSLPSVTRILDASMSEEKRAILNRWKEKMIRDLGEEGFAKYQSELFSSGKMFHSAIEGTLKNIPVEVADNIRGSFESVKSALNEMQDVRIIESCVVNRQLGYKGVIDCVASYRGNLCLIDWKKSDKDKSLLSSTYDAPLQIAAYMGALNSDENYNFQVKSGLIIVGYTSGAPATIFQLDEKKMMHYWEQWLLRLQKYYGNRRS